MIKNTRQLARTPLRKKALAILEAAYKSLETGSMIRRVVRRRGKQLSIHGRKLNLGVYDHVYLVGVGKSSYRTARAVVPIVGKFLTKGIIIDIQGRSFGKVRVYRGTHPFPSSRNVRAVANMQRLLEGATERDLVIAIISGGGSALLCQPIRMSIGKEIEITRTLMHRGATVHEMNIVRKHLSRMRGGGLARAAYPARVVSLIFSDVCGDNLGTISSGPTVYDPTTVADAKSVLKYYKVPTVEFSETPKEKRYFSRVTNLLVGSNQVALDAMSKEAKRQGFAPKIFSRTLQGIASIVGPTLLRSCRLGQALLSGGETTVVVRGGGKGGRNQELALSTVPLIREGMVVASIASDAHDNTDAAGAIVDFTTVERVAKKGLDVKHYLANNDAYHFLKATGDLIFASNRATNVSDLMLVLRLSSSDPAAGGIPLRRDLIRGFRKKKK